MVSKGGSPVWQIAYFWFSGYSNVFIQIVGAVILQEMNESLSNFPKPK